MAQGVGATNVVAVEGDLLQFLEVEVSERMDVVDEIGREEQLLEVLNVEIREEVETGDAIVAEV